MVEIKTIRQNPTVGERGHERVIALTEEFDADNVNGILEPEIVIEEEEEETEEFHIEPAELDNLKGTDDAVGSVSLDEIEDE